MDDQLAAQPDNKPKRHRWAHVIIAIAEGRPVQFVSRQTGEFIDYEPTVHTSPMVGIDVEWRIKPRTIKIGEMEVLEPLRENEEPDIGTDYYVPCLGDSDYFLDDTWLGHSIDYVRLKGNIVHLTKEAAIAHARALIAVSGGTV